MAGDSRQPATKGDLRQEIQQLRTEMRREMQKMKKEILLHFDVVAENMTSNFQGAFSDKLETHEQRIARLACPPKPWRRWEQHTGVAA